jgi:phosphatidylglycerophosphatase A
VLKLGRNFAVFLASGAGIGFLPLIPGTLATLAAIPLSLAINRLVLINPLLAATTLLGLCMIAIVLADQAARILSAKDPQVVVIDEFAGFVLANFLNDTAASIIIAFILFRLFDIAKVFPGRRLEKLPGGVGIVLDDVLAGFYTFVILRSFWAGLL